MNGRRAVVTGAAGFIGSTLSERLLRDGWEVVGIDSITDYYDLEAKRRNLAQLNQNPLFRIHEADLTNMDLDSALKGASHVFHQAGQPGVRGSWADGFAEYTQRNVLATQRLLEAARGQSIQRFVYASSSSVYGNAEAYPTDELMLPRPQSPYGVTKLAGEHLVNLYAANYGLPTTSLRYFTVYGPRQRPDMATHRLIKSAIDGSPFRLFGNGDKVRDFTFVDDVVQANILAALSDTAPGLVFNVAGGSSTSMSELIDVVTECAGNRPNIITEGDAAGDVTRTGGSTVAIHAALGWTPEISIEEGVTRQVAWHLSLAS